MCFSARIDEVLTWLERTDEFLRLIRGDEEFPVNYFFDVRPALKRIRPEGTWMDER